MMTWKVPSIPNCLLINFKTPRVHLERAIQPQRVSEAVIRREEGQEEWIQKLPLRMQSEKDLNLLLCCYI